MKRDDLTPLALGGNKLRKLEFLLGDALARGADTVVTLGAAQSNHACQTAAACAKLGLHTVLLLRGPTDSPSQGNLRLDRIFGAEVRLNPDPPSDWGVQVVAELNESGRTAYLVPYGGSNPVGALGYLAAARELDDRGARFAEVLVTSSSAGTQAGLQLARSNGLLSPPVLGLSVDESAEQLQQRIDELGAATAARFGLEPPGPARVNDRYVGPGYGVADARVLDAVRLLARTEGVLTDPVYTGKALSGLVDLARDGRWSADDEVLFWHTGGLAALFAPLADGLAAPG